MTGIIHDQSNADYHANPALGSTYVKDWALRSPLHAERGEKTINPFIADEGTAAHLVFEGKPELVIEAGEARRGAAWEEAKKHAALVGGVALPKKPFGHAMAAGLSARNNPAMAACLSQDEVWYEASIYTKHPATGLAIKCKPDVYLPNTGTLIDLKTTASAEPYNFTRSCHKFAYHLQAAFYRMVCREAGLRVNSFFNFIAVEKVPPYAAQHFVMEDDLLSFAEQRVEQILLEIAHSRETGEFSTNWPTVFKLNSIIWKDIYDGF